MDAAEREKVLSRYAAHSRVFERIAQRRPSSVVHLVPKTGEVDTPSPRELEVLVLIAEGLTDSEIGSRLFLAPYTVKSHVKHLLAKFGARSRAQAVAVGFRRGFIA